MLRDYHLNKSDVQCNFTAAALQRPPRELYFLSSPHMSFSATCLSRCVCVGVHLMMRCRPFWAPPSRSIGHIYVRWSCLVFQNKINMFAVDAVLHCILTIRTSKEAGYILKDILNSVQYRTEGPTKESSCLSFFCQRQFFFADDWENKERHEEERHWQSPLIGHCLPAGDWRTKPRLLTGLWSMSASSMTTGHLLLIKEKHGQPALSTD